MVQDFLRYKEKYKSDYGRELSIVQMNKNTLNRFIKQCIKKYNMTGMTSEDIMVQVLRGDTQVSCEDTSIECKSLVPDCYMEVY
jgi:hypothetical protein